jgi:hypothetical protein
MRKETITTHLLETTEENQEKVVTNVPVSAEVFSHPFLPNEGNNYCSVSQIVG